MQQNSSAFLNFTGISNHILGKQGVLDSYVRRGPKSYARHAAEKNLAEPTFGAASLVVVLVSTFGLGMTIFEFATCNRTSVLCHSEILDHLHLMLRRNRSDVEPSQTKTSSSGLEHRSGKYYGSLYRTLQTNPFRTLYHIFPVTFLQA